jgi:RNA polymerase sigma-70 factor (ECF subfamily)
MRGEIERRRVDVSSLPKRLRESDLTALEALYYLYQPSLHRFIDSCLEDRAAAEDLVQDTFINLWAARRTVDANKPIAPYIFRIGHNLAVNYLHRFRARYAPLFTAEECPASEGDQPEECAHLTLLTDDIVAAIARLPASCRVVFVLHRFEGFSYTEIAEILGISIQTVKNQVCKALMLLRRQLKPYLLEVYSRRA